MLVIDEVAHRPHMVYQVLTADHYVGGATAPTLRAITARLRQQGIGSGSGTGTGTGTGTVSGTVSGTGTGTGTGTVSGTVSGSGSGTVSGGVEARRERLAAAHAAGEAARRAAEEKALASAEGPVDPAAVAATLRELIGDDAVVVDETITHSRVISRHLMADTPGRYGYVQGGLGQGLGTALGVKLALGDRLTVMTVGDGTWLYNPVPQGLMAAAQYGAVAHRANRSGVVGHRANDYWSRWPTAPIDVSRSEGWPHVY